MGTEVFLPGVKRPGRDDHSRPSNAEVWSDLRYTPIPPMAWRGQCNEDWLYPA